MWASDPGRDSSNVAVAGRRPSCLLITLALLATVLAVPGRAAPTSPLSPDWVRTFGTPGVDEGWGVEVGPTGEIYLAGFLQGQGNDVFLARVEPSGNTAWEIIWNQPFSQKAFEVRHANGYLYVGGVTQRNFAVAAQDMLLLKLWAGNGTLVWYATWNGPADQYDEIDGIVVANGFIYVSGWADVTPDYTSGDMALVQFTDGGAYVAHTLWGGPMREEANGAMAFDGENLYVTGVVGGVSLFTGGDVVLVAFNKTTLAGVWNRTWGGAQVDDGYGLSLLNGSLYVTGITTSFAGDRIFVLKYDTAGRPVFNATWGGSGSEAARAIGVSPDERGIYVAGKTTSYGNGSFDIVLLRYDQTGALEWSRTWGGGGADASHGIALHGDSIYVAGDANSEGIGGSDALLVKVRSDGGPSAPESPPQQPSVGFAIIAAVVAVIIVVTLLALWRRTRQK
jgi:hypothetical protein